MDSLPASKGYLLSSTPVQSSEDSGYFGSGHRRYKSNVNVLNSCSPIKEASVKNVPEDSSFQHEICNVSPPLQFGKNLHGNFIKNESLCSLEVNEFSELEFTNSDYSDRVELHQTCSSITKARKKPLDVHYNSIDTRSLGFHYNSFSSDRDIKYKLFEYESSDLINTDDFQNSKNLSESSFQRDHVKNQLYFYQTKVDFIHELKSRNCLSIISDILSYLSAKELCIASCVSKKWNEVILDDPKANIRRKKFIDERFNFLNGPAKENRMGVKFGPAKEHKKAFSNVTNVNTTLHLPMSSKVSNTKFDSFIREAKNGIKLLKCPRCCYASKKLEGSYCVCTHCSYRFCCHCLDPLLKSHTCIKPQLPNIVVGSRKSKKNLRRL